MLSRFAFAGVVCLLFAAPARAQIYSWRDSAGNLVLSDKRVPGADAAVTSYVVPHAEAIRATRFVPADRTQAYEELIKDNSRANGLRPDLVRAVIQVESGFNPSARSPKGALGLMQLMPATIQQFRVTNPFNPRENVRAGTAYLRQLLDRYDNNEELALAAYNAGPGAVDKHGEAVPPYRETQQYVSKVSELAGPGKAPGGEVYRSIDVIGTQQVPRLSNTPDARITPAALSRADQAARTPDQAPPSASGSQAP
jgi:soluble lytic murein transglycosylase-like protein